MREAGVMLIIRNGLILGVSRRNDRTKFGLPGGKAEKGESPFLAAIRETFEETGINVNKCNFLYERIEPAGSPDGSDFHSFCYYATAWDGEPIDSSEEGDVKWITTKELCDGAFGEYNKTVLEIFRKKYSHIKLTDVIFK